jgi:hypothetical protein
MSPRRMEPDPRWVRTVEAMGMDPDKILRVRWGGPRRGNVVVTFFDGLDPEGGCYSHEETHPAPEGVDRIWQSAEAAAAEVERRREAASEAEQPAGMSIVEFLLARIAEDEEVARRGDERAFVHAVEDAYLPPRYPDPARVLAECQAKRAIVGLHRQVNVFSFAPSGDCAECGDPEAEGWWVRRVDWPCPTLRHLGAVYAYHPDYNPAWRVATGE